MSTLANAEPKMSPDLVNRAADNWRPLLAIADAAGGKWPDRARDAIRQRKAEGSIRELLLTDIRDTYARVDLKDGFISSTNLAVELAQIDERPWAEYGRSGKPITTRRLCDLLKPLEIYPGPNKAGDARGYYKAQFEDAFARYLDPVSSPQGDSGDSSVRSVRNPDGMGTSDLFQSVRKGGASDTSKAAGNADGIDVSDTSDASANDAYFDPIESTGWPEPSEQDNLDTRFEDLIAARVEKLFAGQHQYVLAVMAQALANSVETDGVTGQALERERRQHRRDVRKLQAQIENLQHALGELGDVVALERSRTISLPPLPARGDLN